MEIEGRFFEIGDRIVISPGETNQEFVVIDYLDPLTLTGPLVFNHNDGEYLAFVEAGVTDSDGDNLTDKEEGEIGTDINKFDTDGDGVSDSEELAYGTDPLDVSSRIQFLSTVTNDSENSITAYWEASPGKTYVLKVSYDLETWRELTKITTESTGIESVTFDQLSNGEDRRFYRLRLAD